MKSKRFTQMEKGLKSVQIIKILVICVLKKPFFMIFSKKSNFSLPTVFETVTLA
jgi:hypothetical protein